MNQSSACAEKLESVLVLYACREMSVFGSLWRVVRVCVIHVVCSNFPLSFMISFSSFSFSV